MKNSQARLMLDMDDASTLPANFRKVDSLLASGSGQFSDKSFQYMLSHLPNKHPLVVVDLRQECHGFANGMAISWYGIDNAENSEKSYDDIHQEEEQRLNELATNQEAYLHLQKPPAVDSPFHVTISHTASERAIVPSYIRFPVTDHLAPTLDVATNFVTFIQSLSKPTWLHFHCRKGRGRTTSFLALYDMILHAKEKSFEEVITNQWHLGGSNLLELPAKHCPRYQGKIERIEFLQQFYENIKNQF